MWENATHSYLSLRIPYFHLGDLLLYQLLYELVMEIPACFMLDLQHFSGEEVVALLEMQNLLVFLIAADDRKGDLRQ